MFDCLAPRARFGLPATLWGLVALVAWLPAPWFHPAWAAEPYAHPTITIPYAREKPTIDGVVGDAEWQGNPDD